MTQNRRKFISTVLIAGAALPFTSGPGIVLPSSSERKFPVRLFSKPLDNYDFDFMCECLVKSGIGGFDLTVRPGGKVEPARVETDLPELIQMAGKYNTSVDMIVTGIISVNDKSTAKILKTATASGVKNYRLGWFEYDFKAGIKASLDRYKKSLTDINELNQIYRISGSYQNHSGLYVGASLWDLYEILRDISPEYTGSQYDIRHAVVEGTNSWITGMRLIAPYIKTLAIKDFEWQKVNGRTEALSVPLGEGLVDWELYFKTLKELNISAPITLHVEYPLLTGGEEKLSLPKQQEIIVKKLKKDSEFLNSYLLKYQLI